MVAAALPCTTTRRVVISAGIGQAVPSTSATPPSLGGAPQHGGSARTHMRCTRLAAGPSRIAGSVRGQAHCGSRSRRTPIGIGGHGRRSRGSRRAAATRRRPAGERPAEARREVAHTLRERCTVARTEAAARSEAAAVEGTVEEVSCMAEVAPRVVAGRTVAAARMPVACKAAAARCTREAAEARCRMVHTVAQLATPRVVAVEMHSVAVPEAVTHGTSKAKLVDSCSSALQAPAADLQLLTADVDRRKIRSSRRCRGPSSVAVERSMRTRPTRLTVIEVKLIQDHCSFKTRGV